MSGLLPSGGGSCYRPQPDAAFCRYPLEFESAAELIPRAFVITDTGKV